MTHTFLMVWSVCGSTTMAATAFDGWYSTPGPQPRHRPLHRSRVDDPVALGAVSIGAVAVFECARHLVSACSHITHTHTLHSAAPIHPRPHSDSGVLRPPTAVLLLCQQRVWFPPPLCITDVAPAPPLAVYLMSTSPPKAHRAEAATEIIANAVEEAKALFQQCGGLNVTAIKDRYLGSSSGTPCCPCSRTSGR